jgi:ribose-phosphate pyrophosphokinase
MSFLHLDTTFGNSAESILFQSFYFSGGEPHIKIQQEIPGDEVTITTRINSFNDIGMLLMATDALRRMGVKKLHAVIPYFPAARQDRLMVPGEPLSVKVYADLLNAQQYESVTIFDPHSDVTPAVVNNVRAVSNHAFVQDCLQNVQDYILISPDGGALKKIYKLSEYLGGAPVTECTKKRDVATGRLTKFAVGEADLHGKTCVIVDDICDGGATFTGLAEKLKEHNAGDIYLIVSHGIFSKGTEVLAPFFKKIFTTDSVKTITGDPAVIQQPLLPYLLNR